MPLPIIVDIIIVLALLLYAFDGYRRGFLLLAIEFTGLFVTFYLSIILASQAGQLISRFIAFPTVLEKPIGFLALWLIIQALYVLASSYLYPLIPKPVRFSEANRILGTIPSLAKGLAMLAVILTILVALPFKNEFRPAITESRFGSPLVAATQQIQQQLTRRYSKELTETLTFLTTTPFVSRVQEKGESLDLHFKTTEVTIDSKSEEIMLRLLNKERAKVGLKLLETDVKLRSVARAHAKDMLARGYFSHNTPEGKTPFDRMQEAGIRYVTAGENLAFAPTAELAHSGLMNSPKHRDNILYTEFGKTGIGIIDAGVYGKMFVQEFSD